MWERQIKADLATDFQSPFQRDRVSQAGTNGRSSALIVDAAEFLRSKQLITRYAKRWQQYSQSKKNINQAAQHYVELKQPVQIRSHTEAANYLRKLVAGEETWLETKLGMRKIDAMDRQGIIHQAYYTVNRKYITKVQFPKDRELLEQGRVAGVMWHFFKKTGYPSASFQTELKKKGIVVIFHDQI